MRLQLLRNTFSGVQAMTLGLGAVAGLALAAVGVWLGLLDLVLAENPSTLLRAVPGIMDLDQLGSAITAVCIANDGCGMMARRVATTDIPRRDERPRAPATHADE